MKTSFILNALVASALPSSLDQAKLIQACEASLNAYKVKSTEAARNSVKNYKGGTSEFSEEETIAYIGQTDIVSRFVCWHDKVDKLQADTTRKAEKIGCVASLQVAEIPPSFADWLAKFGSNAQAAPAKPAQSGNGKPAAAKPVAA